MATRISTTLYELSLSDNDQLMVSPTEYAISLMGDRADFAETTVLSVDPGSLDFINEKLLPKLSEIERTYFILWLFCEAAMALQKSCSRFGLHRYVGLESLIVSNDGSVRVIDELIASKLKKHVRDFPEYVVPGSYVFYMAPELVTNLGGPLVLENSDVFSISLIFYELLARKHPFSSHSPLEAMAYSSRMVAPDLRALNPAIPKVVDDLFQRALNREAGLRTRNLEMLSDELRLVLRELSPSIDSDLFLKKLSAGGFFKISDERFTQNTKLPVPEPVTVIEIAETDKSVNSAPLIREPLHEVTETALLKTLQDHGFSNRITGTDFEQTRAKCFVVGRRHLGIPS